MGYPVGYIISSDIVLRYSMVLVADKIIDSLERGSSYYSSYYSSYNSQRNY